jgi:streptomycin 6-kinase
LVLHGDLTPANVLDGGSIRGLVAVDPAPCWDDAAFDPVDLLLWRSEDLATLGARAQELGDQLDSRPERLLRWCAAFAASVALEEAEEAEEASIGASPSARIRMLIDLASSI